MVIAHCAVYFGCQWVITFNSHIQIHYKLSFPCEDSSLSLLQVLNILYKLSFILNTRHTLYPSTVTNGHTLGCIVYCTLVINICNQNMCSFCDCTNNISYIILHCNIFLQKNYNIFLNKKLSSFISYSGY